MPRGPRRPETYRDDVRAVAVVLPHLGVVSLRLAPPYLLEPLAPVIFLPQELGPSGVDLRPLLQGDQGLLRELGLELDLVASFLLDLDLLLFLLLLLGLPLLC